MDFNVKTVIGITAAAVTSFLLFRRFRHYSPNFSSRCVEADLVTSEPDILIEDENASRYRPAVSGTSPVPHYSRRSSQCPLTIDIEVTSSELMQPLKAEVERELVHRIGLPPTAFVVNTRVVHVTPSPHSLVSNRSLLDMAAAQKQTIHRRKRRALSIIPNRHATLAFLCVNRKCVCVVPTPDQRMYGAIPPVFMRHVRWIYNETFFEHEPTSVEELSAVTTPHMRGGSDHSLPSPLDLGPVTPTTPNVPVSLPQICGGPVAGACRETRKTLSRVRRLEDQLCEFAVNVLAPHPQRRSSHQLYTYCEQDLPRDFVLHDPAHPLTPAMQAVASAASIHEEMDAESKQHINQGVDCTSSYIGALFFLLDFAMARTDPLVSSNSVAEILAALIIDGHGGGEWAESVSDAFQLLDLHIEAEILESHDDLVRVLDANRGDLAEVALNHPLNLGALLNRKFNPHVLSSKDENDICLFLFIGCSYGVVLLVRSVYEELRTRIGGEIEFSEFRRQMELLTHIDKVSHWTRIFRSLNRSRSGQLAFMELASHLSRKMSMVSDREIELAHDGSAEDKVALRTLQDGADRVVTKELARLGLLRVLLCRGGLDWTHRATWFESIIEVDD